MKMTLCLMVFAAAVPAANTVGHRAVPADAHPRPPAEYEFYWDDGVIATFWCWYTGGNYWAVQFDEEKTGGIADGTVTAYGAVAYPDWPDSTYQGCYMHVFDDDGGYPGVSLDRTYMAFSNPGYFEWVGTNVLLPTSTFYVAFEQVGDWPYCDSLAADAAGGTHNWTGYGGSWDQPLYFGDFLLRCYWSSDEVPQDITPPFVDDLLPAQGARDVPVDSVIVFHCKDSNSGVDVETIEFTVQDSSKSARHFSLAYSLGGPVPTGVVSGTLYIDDDNPRDVVCTFVPDEDLRGGVFVTCTVDGRLADIVGNMMGDDFNWGFFTKKPYDYDEPAVRSSTWGAIKALY